MHAASRSRFACICRFARISSDTLLCIELLNAADVRRRCRRCRQHTLACACADTKPITCEMCTLNMPFAYARVLYSDTIFPDATIPWPPPQQQQPAVLRTTYLSSRPLVGRTHMTIYTAFECANVCACVFRAAFLLRVYGNVAPLPCIIVVGRYFQIGHTRCAAVDVFMRMRKRQQQRKRAV